MTIVSLLPPLVVFAVGIWTRHIAKALAAGLAVACLAATNFSLFSTTVLFFESIIRNFHTTKLFSNDFIKATNIHILCFVLILGILIEMIMITDSAKAFVRSSSRLIKNQRSAQIGAISLSHLLCMDDYLSSLTSGAVFRPIADKYQISRTRLAFLSDSMAAPLSLITPISSWAAAILGYLTENGIGSTGEEEILIAENPYSVYLQILPYIFYSFAIISSVWFIAGTNLRSKEMFDFSQAKERQEAVISNHARLCDFVLPLFSLLITTAFLLLWLGDWQGIGGTASFIQAIRNTPISFVLFLSGIITTSFSSCYYLARRLLSGPRFIECVKKGFALMFPVVLMLILSWSLGDILQNYLHTGDYIASLISGSIPLELLPLVCFLNALIIAMALGSSWATAAILFPISVPMVLSLSGLEGVTPTIAQVPLLVPCFGAILSGAVCGDHLSLISETTFMAATSAGCEPYEHFKTQLPLSLPAVVAAFCAHAASGYLALSFSAGVTALLCLALALGVCLIGIVISQWQPLTAPCVPE